MYYVCLAVQHELIIISFTFTCELGSAGLWFRLQLSVISHLISSRFYSSLSAVLLCAVCKRGPVYTKSCSCDVRTYICLYFRQVYGTLIKSRSRIGLIMQFVCHSCSELIILPLLKGLVAWGWEQTCQRPLKCAL